MILMDTHIWLRWILPNEPLPQHIVKLINTSESLAVSSISCWEVVLLSKWNKIELPVPVGVWLKEALDGSFVTALPITASVAEHAGLLPYHHKDPADRFIIATASSHGIQVISLDGHFSLYEEINKLLIS